MMDSSEFRTIGSTDLRVSAVAMGCWPIAGITSVDVNETDSVATLRAAVEAGINFFDTAYCYGYHGESEAMIGRVLGAQRDSLVLASKGGIEWRDGRQIKDARPTRILEQCAESLRRLATDRIDLYYLHAPDPAVPVAATAEAFRQLLDAGTIRAVGVSNFTTVEQYERFSQVCPIHADQPPYNMLQREIEADRLPWCRQHDVSARVYWPLMKGFLAGKLDRNHVFDPRDGRRKYPIFQGEQWERTHDFLDRLRPLAASLGKTLSQLVINWTIHQPGITAALCGAKRPEQIRETAGALGWRIPTDILREIDQAIQDRGTVDNRPAV